MRHGLGRIWQKHNRKKDDSTASGNGGSLFFSAISDTSVGTGTVGHAVCHNFWANDEADESASAFSQTPQCHSDSHRGNSVAGGVTLDSGVLDARQPAGMDRQSGTAGAGVAGSRPGAVSQRGRDYWCGHCVSGKYGQWQTTLDDGIRAFIDNISRNYVAYGLTTADTMNPKYAENPAWANNVNNYITRIRNS